MVNYTKKEVIESAFKEFEGLAISSLITKSEAVGLSNWNYDFPILLRLEKGSQRDEVCFMFACFLLLALEEEF